MYVASQNIPCATVLRLGNTVVKLKLGFITAWSVTFELKQDGAFYKSCLYLPLLLLQFLVLLSLLTSIQLLSFILAEHHPVNSHIHYMKQLKHRYCRCRPLVVPFFFHYEFSTLSCATKLEKVPPFVPNIPETENVLQ